MNDSILRGDLYYADLNPVVGSEQGGVRPCLIIQNNTGNRFSPTVIVAAITSKVKPHLPTHLPINCPPELGHTSVVLLEQLRTIDKSRLGRYVGSIGLDAMRLVDAALAVSLDMRRGKAPKPMVMTLCRTCKIQFEDSGFATQLIGSLTDAKDTCDFCNHRRGFNYRVRQK